MSALPPSPITRCSQLPRERLKKRGYSLSLAVLAATHGRLGWAERALARPRVQFLCLHHAFEDEAERFTSLLRWLLDGHTLASYSSAVASLHGAGPAGPTGVVSFDDGFKHHLAAAAMLERAGCRGMFFLCTDALDAAGSPREAARVCRECFGRPHIELLSWADAEVLLKRGHEVGCHTRSHPHLARLSDGEAQDQIGGAAELMRSRLGRVQHFAWPYGRWGSLSPSLASRVFEAGFVSCASAERGAHVVPVSDPRSLCVRREPIEPSVPLARIRYLLARSARDASGSTSAWPDGWRESLGSQLTGSVMGKAVTA